MKWIFCCHQNAQENTSKPELPEVINLLATKNTVGRK